MVEQQIGDSEAINEEVGVGRAVGEGKGVVLVGVGDNSKAINEEVTSPDPTQPSSRFTRCAVVMAHLSDSFQCRCSVE